MAHYSEALWALPEQLLPISLKLPEREIERFLIVASADTCYCEWVVDFHLVATSKRTTVRIDDNGNPFRTSATKKASLTGGRKAAGRSGAAAEAPNEARLAWTRRRRSRRHG